MLFRVQTDATDGKIELRMGAVQAADRTFFRLIGYWEGVDYTEKAEDWWPGSTGVWTDKDLYTLFGVPKGSVCDLNVDNIYASAAYNIGVRIKGSSLARYINVHEAEGGGVGNNYLPFLVKSDVDGVIQYYGHASYSTHYLMGYFSDDVDFDEAWEDVPLAASDAWTEADLDSLSTSPPSSSIVFLILAHATRAAEEYLGAREKGSSQNRYMLEHEAEENGYSGVGMSVNTDGDNIIELYAGNHTTEKFVYQGYFSGVGGQVLYQLCENTIVVNETLTRAATYRKTFNENAGAVDTLGDVTEYHKLLEENAGVADTVLRSLIFHKLIEEGVSIVDIISVAKIYHKLIEEGVSVGEALTTIKIFHTLLEEGVQADEAITHAIKITLTNAAEALEVEGGGVGAGDFPYTFPIEWDDPVFYLQIIASYHKLFEESLGAVDEETIKAFLSFDESVSASESLLFLVKTVLTNGVQVTPTISLLMTLKQLLEENVAANEILTHKMSTTFDESATVSEAVTFLIPLLISEAIDATETLTLAASLFKSLTETVDVSEAITHFIKTEFSESVNVVETLALINTLLIEDSLQVVETLSKITVFKKEFLESVAAQETQNIKMFVEFLETVDAQDTQTTKMYEEILEAINAQDSKTIKMYEEFLESINAQESETIKLYAELLESVTLSDELTPILVFKQLIENTIGISEDLSQKFGITFEESVQLQETLTRVTHFAQLFQEAVTVIDTVTSLTSITLSEQVTVAETLLKSGLFKKLFQESIAATETLGIISFRVYPGVIMSLDLRTRKLTLELDKRDLTLKLDTRKMEIEIE